MSVSAKIGICTLLRIQCTPVDNEKLLVGSSVRFCVGLLRLGAADAAALALALCLHRTIGSMFLLFQYNTANAMESNAVKMGVVEETIWFVETGICCSDMFPRATESVNRQARRTILACCPFAFFTFRPVTYGTALVMMMQAVMWRSVSVTGNLRPD